MNLNTKLRIKKQLKMKKCRYCLSTENLTIDHKIPKIKGGSNDMSNLQCLCKRCNNFKSGFTDGEITSLWKFFTLIDIERTKIGKYPRYQHIILKKLENK